MADGSPVRGIASLRRAIRQGLFCLLACFALQARAVQATDDRGLAVHLPQPARRVVSLLPSLTETVCELGACERLVGVDNYSNWPQQVRALPHLGGLEDASIERIVALRPDLVLMPPSSRALARLEGLGIKVFGLEPKTLADVRRTLDRLGELLGQPGAGRIWSRMNEGIAKAARGVPPSMRGTTVYFEVASGPYAASESSHIGEILARLGAANIVPGRLGSVPKLNPEFIVRADPELIIAAERETFALRHRPGWSGIRAIRAGRVCALTPVQADVVVRPGPRLAEAADILAQCLRSGVRAAGS
jgi:iron complex transport system substrate-binding protein